VVNYRRLFLVPLGFAAAVETDEADQGCDDGNYEEDPDDDEQPEMFIPDGRTIVDEHQRSHVWRQTDVDVRYWIPSLDTHTYIHARMHTSPKLAK